MKFGPSFCIAFCAVTFAAGQAHAQRDDEEARRAAIESIAEGVIINQTTGEVRFSGAADNGYYRAYACPTFAAARAVVGEIPASSDRPGTVARQVEAMRAAIRRHGCSPARGTFRLTAAGPQIAINHGYEAEENWVALSARNIRDRGLGLIVDASPFGSTQ